MCGPSCAHVFSEFLICKRDANTKTCECKFLLYIFYVVMVQGTWGLKECKSRKYFYDDFSMQVQGDEHANPKMQCKI
jgi:hypothetical protein